MTFYSWQRCLIIFWGEVHKPVRTHRTAQLERRMVMAMCGTFDYMFVVPDESQGGKHQMQRMLRALSDHVDALAEAPASLNPGRPRRGRTSGFLS